MSLGQISRVSGDLISDHAIPHVLFVGKTKMFFRRNVAEHRSAKPSDHRRADRRSNVIVSRRYVGDQRPQRIERSFVTDCQLALDVLFYQVKWNVPRSFDHHLAIHVPRDAGQLAESLELGKLRFVVRVCDRSRPQAVAETERHVISAHDLAYLAKPRVEKTLCVVRETPFRHDRAAPRNYSGGSPGGQRYVPQEHPGVYREIVHSLLGLFDQRVPVDLPGELLRLSRYLFELLIDWNRADWNRRISQDPFSRFMNVLSGGEIHHRVAAPFYGPTHLLDLFFDRRGDGGVADICVDLYKEVPTDDHRLRFRMIYVRRYDRAPARHFAANELGCHEI